MSKELLSMPEDPPKDPVFEPVPELFPTEIFKCLRNFQAQIGSSLVPFREGSLIDDPGIIKQLLLTNCPIAPMGQAAHYVSCPSCKHLFPTS